MTNTRRGLRTTAAGLLVLAGSLMPMAAKPQPHEGQNAPLTAQQRHAVVAEIVAKLNAIYIFPAVAHSAADHVRRREEEGGYDKLVAIGAFASALTRDLQDITHDKHVRVRYSERPVEEADGDGDPSPEEMKLLRKSREGINFGIQAVERSSTNMGYIDFRMFAEAEFSREAMTAAMTLIAHTDALIIDLRHNVGGDPATVAHVCSYLFDQRTHLSDLVVRDKPAEEFWTSPAVPGLHFGGTKPVVVLTSRATFSGAEEFAYDLKELRRATIVGETSRGGANPGQDYKVAEHLSLFIPNARSVNPSSGTNWEGVGVVPDVEVPADKARRTAEEMLLKQLIHGGTSGDLLAERRKRLKAIQASP
jgi:hypothetical protein